MASSSCCSDILSTCIFRFLAPGDFRERLRISFGLPRPIGVGGVKSNLASICSVDQSISLLPACSDFCPPFPTEIPLLRLPLCLVRVGASEFFLPFHSCFLLDEIEGSEMNLITVYFPVFGVFFLFVSMVIVCCVPTTAVCGFVWYSLSNLFLFCFFFREFIGKFVTNIAFQSSWRLHDQLVIAFLSGFKEVDL